jgi:hypothetical protein
MPAVLNMGKNDQRRGKLIDQAGESGDFLTGMILVFLPGGR